MAADIYARIRANPKFEGFVGMRNRYSAIMAILGAIAYYGFILLVAYDKEFLAKKIGEGWTTSLGIPLGVGVIVFTIRARPRSCTMTASTPAASILRSCSSASASSPVKTSVLKAT